MPWTNDNYFSVKSQWFTWNNKITEGGKYIFDHFRFYLMLFCLVFYNVYGLVRSEHIEGMNKLKLKCIKCAFHNWKQQAQANYSTCQLAEESFLPCALFKPILLSEAATTNPMTFWNSRTVNSSHAEHRAQLHELRNQSFITQSPEVFKHKFTCKEINRDNKGSTASCGNATPVSESGEEKEI